ncbi:hypothetical protein F5883DRAFT_649100 [Diaporthe sp. PMI_573]|nr:hypothetical protein F5883DRAFT_649100 [Diaporthaceae sp. PMI_573]
MQFSTFKFTVLAILGSATSVSAICPGFNYGIGHVKNLGNGVSRWDVYDTDCRVVDGLSTTENVCNDGIFSCSPAPITFTRYRNSFTHLSYACRTDSRAGSCGGNAISVCCRNDGNRLVAPELEGSELELSEEEFFDEDVSEEEFVEEFPRRPLG